MTCAARWRWCSSARACRCSRSRPVLSREKLLKIYKEVRGVSPPKGMLPFSTDWFMTWQPNVHSSLFMNLHRYFAGAGVHGLDAILKAYHLYLDHIETSVIEPALSLTRAWTRGALFRCRPAATRGVHPLQRRVRRPCA